MILSTARDGFAVDLLVRRRFADAVMVRRVVAFPCDVLADWFLGDDDDSDSSDDDAGAGFDSMKSRRHELLCAHGESDGEDAWLGCYILMLQVVAVDGAP